MAKRTVVDSSNGLSVRVSHNLVQVNKLDQYTEVTLDLDWALWEELVKVVEKKRKKLK